MSDKHVNKRTNNPGYNVKQIISQAQKSQASEQKQANKKPNPK